MIGHVLGPGTGHPVGVLARLTLASVGVLVATAIVAPTTALAQEPPSVPDRIGPRSGWRLHQGEWTDGCVYFADQDGDGRIDYRRAADPCGSFNHRFWLDRDGDGFFDREDTGGDPVPVPLLGERIMATEPGEPVPCFSFWPEPSRPHRLARPLTPELVTLNEFRLGSIAYSVLPADGYPLRFLRDGGVQSENLPADQRWRIDGTHTLVIGPDPGGHRYTYDERCGTLLRDLSFGGGRVSMEIRLLEGPRSP